MVKNDASAIFDTPLAKGNLNNCPNVLYNVAVKLCPCLVAMQKSEVN